MNALTPTPEHATTARETSRLQRLTRVSVALATSLSIHEVMEHLVREARGIVEAERVEVRVQLTGMEEALVASSHAEAEGIGNGAVQLVARLEDRQGQALGELRLSRKPGGEVFSTADEAALEQLTQLASAAIEKAAQVERERQTACTLQESLLPETLPSLSELSIASRYRAGGGGGKVGGDWYDVIPLPDGRVGLVIGDVMGRGISAASVMAQLRIAVRAYALQGMEPSAVLQSVDELVETLQGDYFVTALYALWDLRTCAITFASAGHLAPLLRLPDGTAVFLTGAQEAPIGVHGGRPYREHRVDVPPDSTLILYTDGLLEHREVALGKALGELARAAATGSTDVEELVDELLEALSQSQEDDVAVLVAHHEGSAGDRRRHQRSPDGLLELPPLEQHAREARRWVAENLRERGLGELVEMAELLTSEVVTNAIVHARSDVRVAIDCGTGWARVAVTDDDAQLPSLGALDLEATGGRGMPLLHSIARDWGVYVKPTGKTVWFEAAKT